jgi:predicted nucleotide-binding protein (sugar kinase/HSP70/actin superfamily)
MGNAPKNVDEKMLTTFPKNVDKKMFQTFPKNVNRKKLTTVQKRINKKIKKSWRVGVGGTSCTVLGPLWAL